MSHDQNQGLDAFAALNAEQPEILANVDGRRGDCQRASSGSAVSTRRLVVNVSTSDDPQAPRLSRVSDRRPWSDLLGKSFGWGWLTTNQQGYCDGALLSFDKLEPCLLITVAASNLRVHPIGPELSPHAHSRHATADHLPVS